MPLSNAMNYVIQNIFTGNIVSMQNGLIAAAGPTLVTGPALESWLPMLQDGGTYQFRNPQTNCVIAGWPNGTIFGYAGHFAPDQVWTTTAVSDGDSIYILRNSDNLLYFGDLNGCGVTGGLTGWREVDPYHSSRYHWKFIAVS